MHSSLRVNPLCILYVASLGMAHSASNNENEYIEMTECHKTPPPKKKEDFSRTDFVERDTKSFCTESSRTAILLAQLHLRIRY